MSGVELALAVIPLVLAAIQHRGPLKQAARAMTTSKRSKVRQKLRAEFYDGLCLELSALDTILQTVAADIPFDDKEALRVQYDRTLGTTGGQSFEDTLGVIQQSLDDVVSDRSLGLQGMRLERTALARLKYVKKIAADPTKKQTLSERFRLTNNEQAQRKALNRIRAGIDRLFDLANFSTNLGRESHRGPGRARMTTDRIPSSRSRKLLDSAYKCLVRKWPKDCCNKFQHEARLSLSRCCGSQWKSGEGIDIRVSYPGKPNTPPDWQEVSVIALQERTKLVGFADSSEGEVTPPARPEHDCHSESLCELIRKALHNNNNLRLALEEEKLRKMSPGLTTWRIRQQSGTSLASLLPHGPQNPTLKDRSVLAVTLAHTVLDCLESPWLRNNWNKDHVIFFQKTSSADGVLEIEFGRPFLRVDFQDGSSDASRTETDSAHANPIILSLGILLLEIYTHAAIESQREAQHLSDGQLNANTDLTTAMSVLKGKENDLRVKYRQAVKACLEWKHVGLNGDSLRDKFYEKIVRPLECELIDGFLDTKEDLYSLFG